LPQIIEAKQHEIEMTYSRRDTNLLTSFVGFEVLRSRAHEQYYLMGCAEVKPFRLLPTFRKNTLPQYLGQKTLKIEVKFEGGKKY
jgi:hypothetical protein